MKADFWLAIAAILSTLLAPLLAILVQVRISRFPPEGQRRRKTDRREFRDGPIGLLGMFWTCLPFVLALSLDVYVVVYYRGQTGDSARLRDLALFMAGLKVSAMAALIVLHGLREVTRDQEKALREMLCTGLEPTVASLAQLRDEQIAIQRKLLHRDKAIVTALTKVRDELAVSDAELLREIRASNRTPKGLQTQAPESLPGRKLSVDLKNRRDASR